MSREQIRNLTHDELEESMMLSAFAFQYSIPDNEIEERKRKLKPEQIWGFFADGQLASKLTLIDFDVWIQGRVYAMGGIAGVATWPEHRRGGMVGKLLRHALATMKDRGQTVSMLHPFQFAFYRKFGWETMSDYKQYEIAIGQLPALPSQEGRIVRVKAEAASLGPIYERYAQRYSGMLQRSDEWWNERVLKKNDGTSAAIYYDPQSGEATGYMLYRVKERTMSIQELIWLDDQAWKGLWKFIANHDSMIDKVKLQAPADDQLAFRLSNPRIKQETIPYFMLRVVDAPSFVSQYPFSRTGRPELFTLKLEDEHAPWNTGDWTIRLNGDGTASVKAGLPEGCPSAELTCDIATLSSILVGYAAPVFMQQTGRLGGSVEAARRLQAVLPGMATHLADFF